MLDTHEPHDLRRHVDGDDMTYPPVVRKPVDCHSAGAVSDNRTSTQRLNELAGALLSLTQKVNVLERRLEELQGD